MEDHTWAAIVIIASVALLIIFLGVSAIQGYGMMSMMQGNYGYGAMYLGWIILIIILVIIGAGIYWAKMTGKNRF
jgi:hypothetical protein